MTNCMLERCECCRRCMNRRWLKVCCNAFPTAKLPLRHSILKTLCRLDYQEAPFTEPRMWWGTRPDTSGPIYKTERWAMSDRIEVGAEATAHRRQSRRGHLHHLRAAAHEDFLSGPHRSDAREVRRRHRFLPRRDCRHACHQNADQRGTDPGDRKRCDIHNGNARRSRAGVAGARQQSRAELRRGARRVSAAGR